MSNIDELLKAISDRTEQLATEIPSLRDAVSEESIKALVRTSFDELLQDEDFARKMRFGPGGTDRKIVGTKFARWGLNIADIEFAYDLLTTAKQIGRSNGPSEELENTFRAVSEAFYLPMGKVREIDKQAIDDLFPRIPLSEFYGVDRELAARGEFELTGAYQRAIRAMDTAETGYGLQLVGAQYVGELWEGVRRDSRIFGLIESFEMTAPTAYLPVEADIPEMLFVSENTGPTDNPYATVKTGSNRVQVDAKKFIIHQVWSGEMEEDSIIPFVPFLRRQAQLSLNHYSDSVVLNGDTTNAATGNINLDDADPADTKHYLAFDGIRHAALVDNTANAVDHSAAALTFAAIMALRGKMIDKTYLMDWGHPTDPNDLPIIADPATADEAATITEVKTVDVYGSNATVLTGELARIGGFPIIPSMAMSLTEADGKVSTTPGNNTLGQIAQFNRRGYKTGWRRRVKVEVERLPGRDQTRIVYSLRLGLGRSTPTGAAAGIEHTAVLYNI